MGTDVVLISFVVMVLAVIGGAFLIYRVGLPTEVDFSGIWLNEALNIRILLHDTDSTVFQGSVIWANGMDKLLGFKVVENLKVDKSAKKGKGKYADPITGQVYEISMQFKKKGLLQISAYHPNSNSLAFSQEWKQYVS